MSEQPIWGAPNISKAIGRSLRSTYDLLESDALPGAKKVGGRYAFFPSLFRGSFSDMSRHRVLAAAADKSDAVRPAMRAVSLAVSHEVRS
jgi:hypothetical protein